MTILLIIILFKCTNYMSFFPCMPAHCSPAERILIFVVSMATPSKLHGTATDSHQPREDGFQSKGKLRIKKAKQNQIIMSVTSNDVELLIIGTFKPQTIISLRAGAFSLSPSINLPGWLMMVEKHVC